MLVLGNTTLGQPLTQLWKIREGVKAASAEERISAAELKKAEDEVVLGVTQLYFGLVAAREVVPDLDDLMSWLQEELDLLVDAARETLEEREREAVEGPKRHRPARTGPGGSGKGGGSGVSARRAPGTGSRSGARRPRSS